MINKWNIDNENSLVVRKLFIYMIFVVHIIVQRKTVNGNNIRLT